MEHKHESNNPGASSRACQHRPALSSCRIAMHRTPRLSSVRIREHNSVLPCSFYSTLWKGTSPCKLSPRETRVVALGKPSDRDRTSWYFQRYVPYLPAAQELVLFNRSWYNRAGVERVMGFCTEAEHEEFMGSVSDFENMLVRSGVKFLKYYLDISKDERLIRPDRQIVFAYDASNLENGQLAK